MGQFEIRGLLNHHAPAPRLCDNGRMATKRLRRPRDPIALAKIVGDIATKQIEDRVDDARNPAAVQLGRLGGQRGGKARANKLTAAQRQEIAQKAARKRWSK